MESLPKQHFLETKKLINSVDKKDIADWMLKNGYYPEQYVLPPCFHVERFQLRVKEFYSINKKKTS